MNRNLVYVVSLVIVFNCVMTVAKNSTEKLDITTANKTDELNSQLPTPEMFAEGFGVSTTKSRIVGRKGVNPEGILEVVATSSENVSQLPSSNFTAATIKPSTSTEKPSSSANSTTVSTTLKPSTTQSTTRATSTSTVKTTTTTEKLIRKPTITYSADDDPDILASEKKINFNATKNDEVPKISPDVDRTIIDEQRTRNSYVFFMGLLFGIPMTLTLMHVLYKKIKTWRELRHYQRVVSLYFSLAKQKVANLFSRFKDFLIDGMYIS